MDAIVENEVLFYSKLARRLVVNLSEFNDQILAIAWIRKFLDESTGDEKLRTTYLKLLLSCLQRRRLSGIFTNDPDSYEVLGEFLPDINLLSRSKVPPASSTMEEGANAHADPDYEQTAAQSRSMDEKLLGSPYIVCASPGQLSEHDEFSTHEEKCLPHSPEGGMYISQFDCGPKDVIYADTFAPKIPGVAHRDPDHEKRMVEKRGRRQEVALVRKESSQTAEIMDEAKFSLYIAQETGEMDYDLFDEAPSDLVHSNIPHQSSPRPARPYLHPPLEVTHDPPSRSRRTSSTHGIILQSTSCLQPIVNPPPQYPNFFNPFRGKREATVLEHTGQSQVPPHEGTPRKCRHHHATVRHSPCLQLVGNPASQNREQEFFNPFRGRREVTVLEHTERPQFSLHEGTPGKYHHHHHHHATVRHSPCLQAVVNPASQNQEQEFFNPFRGRREATVLERTQQPHFSLHNETPGKYHHHHHSTIRHSPCLQPVANPPSQNREQEFFNPFRGRKEATVLEHIEQPELPHHEGTPRKYHRPTLQFSSRLQPVANSLSKNQDKEFFNPFRGRREATVLQPIEQPQFPLYERTPKKYYHRNRKRIRTALLPRKLFMDESQVIPEVPPEPCVVCDKEESFMKKRWNGKHGTVSSQRGRPIDFEQLETGKQMESYACVDSSLPELAYTAAELHRVRDYTPSNLRSQRQYAQSPPTPIGVAGPSRRPTWETPVQYDSDFSSSPTPCPQEQKFPKAKKRIFGPPKVNKDYIPDREPALERSLAQPFRVASSTRETSPTRVAFAQTGSCPPPKSPGPKITCPRAAASCAVPKQILVKNISPGRQLGEIRSTPPSNEKLTKEVQAQGKSEKAVMQNQKQSEAQRKQHPSLMETPEMQAFDYKKTGSTAEVVRPSEKKTGNRYGTEVLNAVRRNLFGSRRGDMDLSQYTDKSSSTQKRRETLHERHPGQGSQDFNQFMQDTQSQTPSPLRRRTYFSSHGKSPGSSEHLNEFERLHKGIEQLSQFPSGLKAEMEECRRTAWREGKAISMELYPTIIGPGIDVEKLAVELPRSRSPQNVDSPRIYPGGGFSPGYIRFCEADEDNGYFSKAMQAGQGPMLDRTYIDQSPAMNELPESMSPQIREGCRLTQRLVDEMMFYMPDNQTADDENEIFEGYDSPYSLHTSLKRPKERKSDDQTLDEFIRGHHKRYEPKIEAIPKQIIANKERIRGQDRFKKDSQQDSKQENGGYRFARSPPALSSSNGTQSLRKIAEKTRSI